MADVLFVVVVVAFFAVAAAFVVACDRIIGPDDLSEADAAPEDDVVEVVAR